MSDISTNTWSFPYPWGAFSDLREVIVVDSTPPNQGQSQVLNNNAPPIVVPPYGRVFLRFSLDGTIAYSAPIPVNVVPLAIPIGGDIRREYEVVVESSVGQNLTFQIFNATDLDRAPF